MEELKTNIKNWIECDNYLKESKKKIQEINEKNKSVLKKRDELNKKITTVLANNNMKDHIINVTDGDIRYNETVSQVPISLKHLKNLLDNYFNSDEQSNKLYNYIKENREYKTIIDLKRKINN